MSRIILVKKRSAWEQRQANGAGELTEVTRTRLQASHDRHSASLEMVQDALAQLKVRPKVIDGPEKPFKAGVGDIVVTVGGDGTVLSASHNMGPKSLLLAINSDPVFSRGRFCNVYSSVRQVRQALEKALLGKLKMTSVPRMAVRIDNKLVHQRVLNEVLFSHTCPAAMTRVAPPGKTRYACSGLWIGTAAGSTGALRSAGGQVMKITKSTLQAIVREPCDPVGEQNIVWESKEFEFTNFTADAAIFVDGAFLRIPVGFESKMRFQVSDEPLAILGLRA